MKFNILIDNILQNALGVILSSERQLGSKDIATMSGILTVQWHFDRLSDRQFVTGTLAELRLVGGRIVTSTSSMTGGNGFGKYCELV